MADIKEVFEDDRGAVTVELGRSWVLLSRKVNGRKTSIGFSTQILKRIYELHKSMLSGTSGAKGGD